LALKLGCIVARSNAEVNPTPSRGQTVRGTLSVEAGRAGATRDTRLTSISWHDILRTRGFPMSQTQLHPVPQPHPSSRQPHPKIKNAFKRRIAMLRTRTVARMAVCAFFTLPIGLSPALAQSGASTGKVAIHVSPKQAYLFVDGNAIRDGSQTIALSAGKHKIGVYNYGYNPDIQTVEVVSGKTTDMNVTLQKSGDKVAGPFGDIELKGHPRAAVLLNGNTPSYFVGHVDEFDNNWIWHQWLLVKPGIYPVTVTQKGKPSGRVRLM